MNIICNMAAGEGRAQDRWKKFSRDLTAAGIDFKVHFTEARGHASVLSAEIASSDRRDHRLCVFGGDGTLNEVIQGLFSDDRPVDPNLELVFIPAGSSCDFERSIMKHPVFTERALSRDVIRVDIGKVTCRTRSGEPTSRYFINNSSIGVISEANQMFSNALGFTRWIKHRSVDAAAILAGLDTILHFRELHATFSSSTLPESRIKVSNVTVFKNPFFGGGMNYGKDPGRSSGKFGIAVVRELSKAGLMRLIPMLYLTDVTVKPYVIYTEDKVFDIITGRPVDIETDGEVAGVAPAHYEILPEILKVVV